MLAIIACGADRGGRIYSVVGSPQLISPRYDDGPCLVLISRQGNPNPTASDLPKNERREGRLRVPIPMPSDKVLLMSELA